MRLTSDSFRPGQPFPVRCAFAKPDPESHVVFAGNRNPHLAWSDLPAGTRSLALVVHDPDVPSRPDDVNREGRTVPADLPRTEFFHWVLVDLPATVRAIEEGSFGKGVTPKGKPGPAGPRGTRQGLNGYTRWFEGDPEMEGEYFGYDGPCPPWNDSIVHHYHVTLYALDVERCPVEGAFDGPSVRKAIEGHVLGRASILGTYTINPDAVDRG